MTNQLASLARRDYFYLDAFWWVNLGMYIINIYILVMFGLSTLNSNQSNDIKLCKKLANQKCRHISLRRCGIQT